jgi:hypothetical protein
MNPDDFKQTWQAQTSPAQLAIDAELLLTELRRNQQYFTATIYWRDVREVGTAVLMLPVWVFMGVKLSLPWTWYLTVPALMWIAGFMLVDRIRHKRATPGPGESLRQRAEISLYQVKHQIWLLRNVLWWYLLPLAVPMLIFFGEIAWQVRSSGWQAALVFTLASAVVAISFGAIYRLNQYAVRSELAPRRDELESLLKGLQDEVP